MTIEQKKRIFLIFSCTASVQIIALSGLVAYWLILRRGTIETEWCSLLEIKSNGNPDLLGQLIVKTDKNTNRNKTCGSLHTMLEAVVAKRIHKSYDSEINPEYLPLNVTGFGCTDSQRTVSTLQLFNITQLVIPVGRQTKDNWYSKQGTEIGVKALLEEGVISIKQSGYYFVSSLLTLRAQNPNATDSAKQTEGVMSHLVNVIHHDDMTNRVLLENVRSMCELAFEHEEWSSYIGADFHLNEHDLVYMATSHPYNIFTGISCLRHYFRSFGRKRVDRKLLKLLC